MTRLSQTILAITSAASFALTPVVGLAEGHGMQMMDGMMKFEDLEWMPMAEGSPAEITILWGDPATGPVGMLIRTPPGFEAPIHKHSSNYNAVVIQGMHRHWVEGEDPEAMPALGPGSYFSQIAEEFHGDANAGDVPVVGFVYFDGPVDNIPKE